MITVHHLNSSRSKRVLWLLEELQMPYELVKHQRDAKTRLAPASLKAIHPLGKAPIIVDGDVTLCESGAVMEYILDLDSLEQKRERRLRPAVNHPDYHRYLEWLHFAEGSLGLPIITRMFMSMEERDGTQLMDGYIAKEIAADFDYIESTLVARPYFTGSMFTAADIMMTISLEMAERVGLLTDRTATLAYLKRTRARPAYQAAAEHG